MSVPTTLLGCVLQPLHYGDHQRLGLLFPFVLSDTMLSIHIFNPLLLVLWALNTKRNYFLPLCNSLSHTWNNWPSFNLCSGLLFSGLQPINPHPSWKENHCIFAQDHFMHFCSLHHPYNLIRFLPFFQQQNTVDSHSACGAGIAVLPLRQPMGSWLTWLNLAPEVSTGIGRRLWALDLWQCFLRSWVFNSASNRRKGNFSPIKKEEKREPVRNRTDR